MRRNRRAVLWGALALALLCGCGGEQDASQRHSVALVVKSTQSEFFRSVFAGAEAAAAEYNLELSIAGPETEEDYETQNRLIAEAVRAGAEAIVFSAIDQEENAAAIDAAAQAGLQIVTIDSSVDSDQVSTYIGTDNYAAGQMAADAFAASGRAEITAVVNTLTEAGRAQADTAALLTEHPEINVLLALNEPTSVGAAQAVKALGRSEDVFFVGFDSNVVTVDGLQDGCVDALVVQNPYAMGYLGVESAYQLLAGQGGALDETVDTSTRIVDRDNLFTLDSQKALFSFEEHLN